MCKIFDAMRAQGVAATAFVLTLFAAILYDIPARCEQVPGNLPAASTQESWHADLIEAWQAREREAYTLRVEWVEERTVKKGSKTSLADPPITYPTEDQQVRNRKQIVLKGDKVSYQSDGQIHSVGEEGVKLALLGYQSTFDEEEPRQLFDGKTRDSLTGYIEASEKFTEFNDSTVFPALLHVRGMSKQLRLDSSSKLHPLAGFEVVGDIECRVLEAAYATSFRRYYVNPQAAYRIERFEVLHKNRSRIYNIEFDYADAPPIGGALKGWTTVSYDGGSEITEISLVTVHEYELGLDVDDEIFTLNFPSGTYVSDRRRDHESIIRPDGSVRIILASERRLQPTHEELMATDTGGLQQRRANAAYLRRFLINIAVSGLGILAVVILIRKLRQG